jgi:peptide/nickel transport system substrate-binding protein
MSSIWTSRRRALTVAVAGLLAAGLIWGIGTALAASSTPLPSPSGKTILRLGWTVHPDSLNPYVGFLSSAYEVWALNYDILCGYDATTMTQPQGLDKATGLAYQWSHTPDGKVWTFKVRSGVKWQDGVLFTAADVAFTYNYIIKGNMSNFTSYTTFIDRVEAPDATTVVFYCSKPKANMTSLWVPILPEHIWKNISYKAAGTSFENKPPIIGTGPFKTIENVKDQYVRLVANKSYWRGAPKIDEVIFQNYQNTDTMAQDLKSGGLQAAWNIPVAQMKMLNQKPLTSIACATIGLDEVAFNCYTGPSLGAKALTDPAFRQALNWAVDKNKINQLAYYGLATPATSIVTGGYYETYPDWHWTPPANEAYGFDLQKAGQLLTQAGYPLKNGKRVDKQGKPISLRLWARTQSDTSQASGRLLTGWFRQLGLDIKYSVIDENTITDRILNQVNGKLTPDYDMFLWGWGGDVDPNFILSVFISSQIGNWNDASWSNPEYDRLFNQQQTTLDTAKRLQLVNRMQQIFYQQSPYIVLAYPKDVEAYNRVDWVGWVRAPANRGGVFYTTQNATYLAVHPVAAEAAGGGSGSKTGLIAAIVVAVLIVAGIAFWLVRRGRKPQELEG